MILCIYLLCAFTMHLSSVREERVIYYILYSINFYELRNACRGDPIMPLSNGSTVVQYSSTRAVSTHYVFSLLVQHDTDKYQVQVPAGTHPRDYSIRTPSVLHGNIYYYHALH